MRNHRLSTKTWFFLHQVLPVHQDRWVDLELLYQAQFWNPFFDINYYGSSLFGVFFAACPPWKDSMLWSKAFLNIYYYMNYLGCASSTLLSTSEQVTLQSSALMKLCLSDTNLLW
jgi:hypothetical protein